MNPPPAPPRPSRAPSRSRGCPARISAISSATRPRRRARGFNRAAASDEAVTTVTTAGGSKPPPPVTTTVHSRVRYPRPRRGLQGYPSPPSVDPKPIANRQLLATPASRARAAEVALPAPGLAPALAAPGRPRPGSALLEAVDRDRTLRWTGITIDRYRRTRLTSRHGRRVEADKRRLQEELDGKAAARGAVGGAHAVRERDLAERERDPRRSWRPCEPAVAAPRRGGDPGDPAAPSARAAPARPGTTPVRSRRAFASPCASR